MVASNNVFPGLIEVDDVKDYELNPRFGIASFCIMADELQHDIRARGFLKSKHQIWGVKTIVSAITQE